MSWRALIGKLAIALLILPAALMPATAGAEVLDELVVLTENADAVIRISFGLRIQYLRHEIFGDGFVEIGGHGPMIRPCACEAPTFALDMGK